jgi:hypothetical protein
MNRENRRVEGWKEGEVMGEIDASLDAVLTSSLLLCFLLVSAAGLLLKLIADACGLGEAGL